MDLHYYDRIILNSSGGKDSAVAEYEVCRLADLQGYPKSNIVVSHQDLGVYEWPGTKELVKEQADHFGVRMVVSWRVDKYGHRETLLEYVLRRGMWPSQGNRWCTSDFKRGPGARVVTAETKDLGHCRVLYVFGFRADESPARKKKEIFTRNEKLSTHRREVYDWLPVHDWSLRRVWSTIREHKIPYHYAYDLGMPRLSCIFCFMSPFDALVLAGIHNPTVLEEYVYVEEVTGHQFRIDFSIKSVKQAIQSGYVPKKISNWIM